MSQGHNARASHATTAGRAGIMGGMTTRFKRTRNRILGIKTPMPNWSTRMQELTPYIAEGWRQGFERAQTAAAPVIDPNWKPPLQLTREQYANLIDALEAHGWTQDWGYEGEGVSVYWPDMKSDHWITQQANAIGGGWISWREENGAVIYSLSDDRDSTADRVDIDTGGSDDPKVIALAIDHALHMAWHEYEDERRDQARRMERQLRRVEELGRRRIVMPGQIRSALAEPDASK